MKVENENTRNSLNYSVTPQSVEKTNGGGRMKWIVLTQTLEDKELKKEVSDDDDKDDDHNIIVKWR